MKRCFLIMDARAETNDNAVILEQCWTLKEAIANAPDYGDCNVIWRNDINKKGAVVSDKMVGRVVGGKFKPSTKNKDKNN